ECALHLKDGLEQVRALAALAPRLTPRRKRRLLKRALDTALESGADFHTTGSVRDRRSHIRSLLALVPQLRGEPKRRACRRALEVAMALPEQGNGRANPRLQALKEVFPHLMGESLERASQAILMSENRVAGIRY